MTAPDVTAGALALRSVSRHFGRLRAVDTVELEFPRGAVTAVIGPSGCGKSTLLKLCNGLARPESGHVEVFGDPIDYRRLPELRRCIGYAVQGNGLFPHMTAEQNITLPARIADGSPTDVATRVRELLALTHLQPEQLCKYPHQLSGGQQQRVGLCRAMMLRPRILLLDEPFAAIDPITRRDIHARFLELHRAEPTTAVLVTHDMREAIKLAAHLVVMHAGRVIHSVSTETLLAENPGTDPESLLHDLLAESGR